MYIRRLILLIAILLSAASSWALRPQKPIVTENTADSLRMLMSSATSAEDSMLITVDLFDVLPRGRQREDIARTTIDLALKTGNSLIGLDAVRNLANCHDKDLHQLTLDRELALKFPDSQDRDETLCFLDICENYYAAKYAPEPERISMLDKLIRRFNDDHEYSVYDNITMLHAICQNISEDNMYDRNRKYLPTLDSLVNSLRPEAYFLKNIFLVQASLVYANNDYRKAYGVKYDKRLLQLIDSMDCGSYGMNRKFRNYDPNRYVLYTRILANYDSLPANEVDKYYLMAMRVVERDATSAVTNEASLRPQIYHAMKHKNYDYAMPLLKQAVDMPYNKSIKPYILAMTIQCAKQLGDKDALIDASLAFNDYLKKANAENSAKKWKELEIVYDLAQMKQEHMSKAAEMKAKQLWLAWGVSILLLVLIATLAWLLIRSRNLTKSLKASNASLIAERKSLMKAEQDLAAARDRAQLANRTKSAFMKNMTYEISVPLHTINEYTSLIISESELSKKPFLRKYADMVALNIEIVSTLISDLTVLSDIDSGSIHLNHSRENLKDVCQIAINSVSHMLQPDVKLALDPAMPRVVVTTDKRRLLHILLQLLSNAAKFTPSGSITISCDQRPGYSAAIIVEDTGIGVPQSQRERIFERFVKLDPGVHGAGIGLPLARQLARLMGGDLIIEPTHSGARFVILLK